MKKIKGIFSVIAAVICALCVFTLTSSAADEGKWISAWSTAPTEIGVEGYENLVPVVQKVAMRTVITPTASGSKIRVKFSNCYGKGDLVIDRATVAVSTGKSGIDKSTLKFLTFSDSLNVTIPAGEEIYSDAVLFETTVGEEIAVSTFISEFSEVRSMGLYGGATYLNVSFEGSGIDMVEAENFNPLSGIEFEEQWVYDMLDVLLGSILGQGTLEIPVTAGRVEVVPVITDIDVLNPDDDAYSVVVIGDSTVANSFPSHLAEEIGKHKSNVGVSAKGLFGNSLIIDGEGYNSLIYGEPLVERMKRDIIGLDGKNQKNVKYVVLKTGSADIIHPVCSNIQGIDQPSASEIIDGYIEVFNFCRENGIKVIVIGITPWGAYSGTELPTGPQYDRTPEERRQDWQIALDVNKWLFNTSLHDGYIDYNEMSKSPLDSSALLPEYTTNGLLPSKVLQKKWAEEFPLALIGIGDETSAAGIGISEAESTLYLGERKTLTAKVVPATANQAVTWSSSNPSVVSVDSKGNITPNKKGTAIITVKSVDKGYNGRGYSASCTVTVKVKPQAVKINGDANTIFTTKSLKLSATVSPSDTDFKSVIWSSSNEKVATVGADGLVTATGAGKAVITAASTFDNKIKATFNITVKKKVQVQAIYLNYDQKSLYVGNSFTLTTSMNPVNASFPEVTWSSSDKKVATVTKDGKVKGLKKGTAIISCKSVDNPGVAVHCIVTVKIKTTGVKLPSKKLTLYVSEEKILKAEVNPSNASNKKVTWSSSNKKVATVSKSGKIIAKKPGKTTITVKTKNGGYKAKCVVTVKKYVKLNSFKLNKTSVSINDGKSYTLKATFSPSNASDKALIWKSSNTKIATVSSTGVVKGVKPGKCTISCKSRETGKTVKCTVTIKRVKVKKVLFTQKVYTVNHKGKLQLTALISPTNATNQKIKWKSSHPEYVKVSSKGKVTGLKLGKTVKITATAVDGKVIGTCRVKVAKVAVTGLKLNKSTASVFTGSTVTLTPKLTPSNPTNDKLVWNSSDSKLATVSSDGVVKALREGTVKITCTSDDGGYTASCTVVIEKGIRVTGVTLDKESEEANVGAEFNLVATVAPYNASNKKLIWTSTNPSVAEVSANGRVTALKEGLTYIRVKTEDGSRVASCRIKVVP